MPDKVDRSNEDWSEVEEEGLITSTLTSLDYIHNALMGNVMPYDESKLARYEDEEKNLFVSTIYAEDVRKYETAVHHPLYCNDDELIIVEYYDNVIEAEAGHARWVAMVSGEEPMPESVKSVQNMIIYHRKEEQ